MEFKEITHTDNIWEDIRNILSEENGTLIFFYRHLIDAFKMKGVCRLNNCDKYLSSSYMSSNVDCFAKTILHENEVTDFVGILYKTNNLCQVISFRSRNLNDFEEIKPDYCKTKRIVFLK